MLRTCAFPAVAVLLLGSAAAFQLPKRAPAIGLLRSAQAPLVAPARCGVQRFSTADEETTRAVKLEYRKNNIVEQSTSVAIVGFILFVCTVELINPVVRLAALTYMVWSLWEYCFHKFGMHAPFGSLGDQLLGPYNRLHIQHHSETNKDMTMREGFDPHGIYFSTKSTIGAMFASTASLSLIIAVTHIGIPFWMTVPASVLMSLCHGLYWNRLHAQSHFVSLEYDDGLPIVDAIPTDNFVGKWLLRNHIGHHDVKGMGNYNIVLPGADHVFGTFWQPKA